MRSALLIAALGALAAVLRFDLIENEVLAPLCLEAAPPLWCGPAGLADVAFRHWGVGVASLASAVAAFRHRWLALPAMAVGIVALAFGHAVPAAPAVILALLLHAQHRGRQQQADESPA